MRGEPHCLSSPVAAPWLAAVAEAPQPGVPAAPAPQRPSRPRLQSRWGGGGGTRPGRRALASEGRGPARVPGAVCRPSVSLPLVVVCSVALGTVTGPRVLPAPPPAVPRGRRARGALGPAAAASSRRDRAGNGDTRRDPAFLSEKNGAVKKRRSNQADVPDSLCQEAETCYRLRLPEDFYQFWKFCEELDPEKPSDALVSSVGLKLVGPYDILAGKHKKAKATDVNFNLHWRFFYDPPEFQTILVGDSRTQYHMGYFRDVPDELPVWVGANEAKKGCVISQVGDNVFAAVKLFLSKKLKEVADKKKNAILKDIDEKLTRTAKELGYSLEQKTLKMKQRDKKVVTKAFHGAGLVVPVDKNDVGYRELPETNANLKKICKAIVDAPTDEERVKAFAPIQEMLTFVQFANDECDYGMGYELGMDLFCYGSHYFHKTVGQLLPLAYTLLKRNLFAEIIEQHLGSRREEGLDRLAP
ncbi:histone PARylation factor 1 [Pyrgilauda ruficollis]|uniref:histone PARylation factor 1 n=1 Tax=Pyrgilauda ruficollis TaxID=221976 RepID=UPI001B88275D|nr:histone PARylation factor 1 [Pyrgilauda ruficollis]